MNEFTREICIDKLKAFIDSLAKAKSGELQLYYVNMAEGFLLGLFYADIVTDKEYRLLLRTIDEAFLAN